MTQSMPDEVTVSRVVEANQLQVWRALTDPRLMKQWMAPPEIDLTVEVDWRVGGAFVVRGLHHLPFENRGTVLRFEPTSLIRHTYLSSLSRLSDAPENYSVFEFNLTPEEERTRLAIRVSGFPTTAIYHHLEFYWDTTVHILKRFVETGLR